MEFGLDMMDLVLWAQRSRPPSPGAAIGPIFCVCCGAILALGLGLVPLIGMWKAFEKAGEPGWAALIPIYNGMIMSKIAGLGEGYFFMTLIPCAGIYFAFIIILEFCKQFGKEGGFAVGMFLLPYIFWPMLGFGSARYVGARGGSARGGRARRRQADEYEDEY